MIIFNDNEIDAEFNQKTGVVRIKVLDPTGEDSWKVDDILIGEDLARKLANDILAALA